MQTSNSFRKEERLCSRKLIEKLVLEGKSINSYPFRLKWLKTELKTKYPAQLAISVSKRNFKRAVDRNRIKRLMREVYRKNKAIFYETLKLQQSQCVLLLSYTAKTIPEYLEVEKKLILLLQKFQKELSG
jgi:ribonuclease P protein component